MRARLTACLAIALISPAGPALSQGLPVTLTCNLSILCPDTGACRDWDQQITIIEEEDGWQVTWNADLPSDYELIADYLPPDGAVEEFRVRSLLYRNTQTQSSQMVTFDSGGGVVVTGHQPQAATRTVTGIGTCSVPE